MTISYSEQIESYSNTTNSHIIFYPMHKTTQFGKGELTFEINSNRGDLFITGDPDRAVVFYGFVNEFSENFASSWDAQQYYGKTDPIVGFKNTKRTISLAWKIPNSSINEAKYAYNSLNNLARSLYPTYMASPIEVKKNKKAISELLLQPSSATDQLKSLITGEPSSMPLGKPPLFGVSWGQLIKNRDPTAFDLDDYEYDSEDDPAYRMSNQMLICHIENFTMSPQVDAGYFVDGPNLYPKVWNCSVAMTVQHTHELGRQAAIW